MNDDMTKFCEQLVRLNGTMRALFSSGNLELFLEMHAAIKEMHRLQHGSENAALMAIEPECRIIYENFDMILRVVRTTENDVLDEGAQKALNKFLHNIDEAVVNIAKAYELV